MPLISVIVPVYKVEPYLRRCVDSLLAQSFSDLELILVDDGSPDNCGAICDEYAAQDGRVHVIHKENGGLSSARNAGIDWAFQNSDSRWLAFVDSDDWVHPQYLELLYRAATENSVSVSACGVQKLQNEQPEPPVTEPPTVMDWEDLLVDRGWLAVIACNKLYARELFKTLRYPVGKLHEDEFLTYKLLFGAKRTVWIPAALYYYFQNPDSITETAFSLKRLDAIAALKERLIFTRRHGHRKLFVKDIRRYMYLCTTDAAHLEKAENIPAAVRKQEICRLRRAVRGVLLRFGSYCRPIKQYKRYFSFAFPGIWHTARAIRKAAKKNLG